MAHNVPTASKCPFSASSVGSLIAVWVPSEYPAGWQMMSRQGHLVPPFSSCNHFSNQWEVWRRSRNGQK